MSDFEFDIENIDTTPDSINFLPVNDFYTTDHRLRVQWDIGNSFEPDSLDYVGLYNTEWETINEYLAYKWAPFTPRHPFSLRRRCVQFTDADFDVSIHVYNFLWIANRLKYFNNAKWYLEYRISNIKNLCCCHLLQRTV